MKRAKIEYATTVAKETAADSSRWTAQMVAVAPAVMPANGRDGEPDGVDRRCKAVYMQMRMELSSLRSRVVALIWAMGE